MKKIVIDGKTVKTKEQFHSFIKKEMDFPKHYGENLDALYDCVSECDSDTVVEFKNHIEFMENLGNYAEGIIEVFEDAKDDGYIKDVIYSK